jgi:CBS domain-containing protein
MSAIRNILKTKSPTVHSIVAEATVLRAVRMMCTHHIGALLVEREGGLAGILSERDIMIRVLLAQRDPSSTTVAEVMTRDLVCLDADGEAEEAMALMTERRIRHLPILERGSVSGIVSIGDLVRWVSAKQEYEIRTLNEYVSGVYA